MSIDIQDQDMACDLEYLYFIDFDILIWHVEAHF